MGFLDVVSHGQAAELHQHAVPDVAVVFAAPGLQILDQAEFDELLVEHEVECDEVRPPLLEGAGVLLDGAGGLRHPRLQLTARVADDLVECRVDLSG